MHEINIDAFSIKFNRKLFSSFLLNHMSSVLWVNAMHLLPWVCFFCSAAVADCSREASAVSGCRLGSRGEVLLQRVEQSGRRWTGGADCQGESFFTAEKLRSVLSKPNVAVKWLWILFHAREFPVYMLVQRAAMVTGFVWFSAVPPGNRRDSTSSRQQLLSSTYLKIDYSLLITVFYAM
jgi:hypothetical protein